MRFVIQATAAGSRARLGRLTTAHGAVETPVFMPVGTRGTVRTQTRRELGELHGLGAGVLLANTYHLMQRPGLALFERVGGLHAWMKWPGAILTDSGGYQVFSLAGCAVDEDGATLREPGGAEVRLTPERSVAAQRAIGADLRMVLDHCVAATCEEGEARDAMARTHRWALRSRAAHGSDAAALFAIVQGARFTELRRASADALVDAGGFAGYAIGGLAVGESRAEREDLTALVAERLPVWQPRYLMGVGTPLDLAEAVHRGVDLFDCILPTAAAQYGHAFTSRGKVDLARTAHATSDAPLDAACDCEACSVYARSYLHHLVKCREPLGWHLLASHNLRFYARLMRTMRVQIAAGTFAAWHAQERQVLGALDLDSEPGPRPRKKRRAPTAQGEYVLARAGEIRHAKTGAVLAAPDPQWFARSRRLAELLAGARTEPLVVWDLDLGVAHLAMQIVRAHEAARDTAALAPLSLMSFGRDRDALQLALHHAGGFPHLHHAAPPALATAARYTAPGLTWTAHADPATAPRPHVLFAARADLAAPFVDEAIELVLP